MCGLAGFWDHLSPTEAQKVALNMSDRIEHRGPDGFGIWNDEAAHLTLMHRRLAILDLSSSGAQPMHSASQRYVLAFNGEIYNHLEMRSDLELLGAAPQWQGHSDTETLLAALEYWGIKETLQRLNGMFAFAFWDKKMRKLVLARDRAGEKPLYYGRCGKAFLFTSELKALTAHPEWQGDIDRTALHLYLRYSYVPCPKSIYVGINKLPPAHYIEIEENGHNISEPTAYWDLEAVATQPRVYDAAQPEEAIDALDRLLEKAVRSRMSADVPLGALLSGGYDSSTVAAYMQRQSSQDIKTFSIGFNEAGYNEAEHAKAVATHLGTDHTELYVSTQDALNVIPKLPHIYDEPFADPSQIPTYLVCEMARKSVTVCLSGDGGDELFCGYNRHAMGFDIFQKMKKLPYPIRVAIGKMMGRVPPSMLEAAQHILPKATRVQNISERLPKLLKVLSCADGQEFYDSLISQSVNTVDLLQPHPDLSSAKLTFNTHLLDQVSDMRDQMMLMDIQTYLHDDVLTKVDRASMAVNLEARVPLLDHRLIEFAWQVPVGLKYRDKTGKWLLRQALHRHVPKEIMERPKMGFGVPVSTWLRGPLRDWAEQLLDPKSMQQEGFLNPTAVQDIWRKHLNGTEGLQYTLWNILMFQAWMRNMHAS
ncbi:asparagine synthase (glutamine-hydrolyzing) [Thalassobius sp. Cn5-15]|uniref:asparagine synthase (glutamine-hydrolyzing) n=1 Tax=Thalassobius sp. Cn5-15 TaxID=2917763 RepID=UPI001EF32B76|nr:asparagine synthase (glutamine-hydrolyzing) [Thalassobius sp. Cn5-15]MCG7495011.1 asparagine synthase (glutamine-hydrolyzing) [Thalassobius sp. Cn5-15]